MRWEPASNKTSFWDMLPNFRLPNCPHGPFATLLYIRTLCSGLAM